MRRTHRNSAPSSTPPLESTADLLEQARDGNEDATNRLFERYYPAIRRLASGRLPASMRDLRDTDDLVQETLVRALKNVDRFEYRHEGAFLAYLRQILLNEIRQESRRVKRRPRKEPLDDVRVDNAETPSQVASRVETVERYELALRALSEEQREAVIMRIEYGYAYEEIAQAMERPSANAVRMMVARALAKLARSMESVTQEDSAKRSSNDE